MNIKAIKIIYPIVLIVLVIFSRVIVSENYYYGYDSVNYALAVENYSLDETRPHLPGSILFVKSIGLLTLVTNNIHSSFLFLIHILSVLATLLSYKIFQKYFDLTESFLLSLFLIFNPMVWFYGAVTEIYIFDWFFVSLVLYISQKSSAVYLLPLVFAIGSGFRPSSGVLLLPFYLYILWNNNQTNWKYFCVSVLLAFGLFLGWFIHLTSNAGGIIEFFELFSKNNPMESISFAQNIFRLSSIALYLLVPFLLLMPFIKWDTIRANKSQLISLMFVIIPPALFFLFSHYSKGYALIIVTPLVLLFGLLIRRRLVNLLQIVIAFEIALFLFFPSTSTSMQSKIKPELREVSLGQIWLDRTISDYSLTSEQITNRDNEMVDLINSVRDSKKTKVILGPLLSQMGRALQIYYPEKNIYAVNFRSGNEFIKFNRNKVGFEKINSNWENVSIILNKKVYHKYFSNCKVENSFGDLITIKFNSKNCNSLENIIKSQFVR